jgi:hypothetical protein
LPISSYYNVIRIDYPHTEALTTLDTNDVVIDDDTLVDYPNLLSDSTPKAEDQETFQDFDQQDTVVQLQPQSEAEPIELVRHLPFAGLSSGSDATMLVWACTC